MDALNSLEFSDDQLRSFRQKQIQSITLIAPDHCYDARAPYLVDLVQLRELRKCIKFYGCQVPLLNLEAFDWDHGNGTRWEGFNSHKRQDIEIPGNFFAQSVLNVQLGDQKLIFPLTGMEMAYAFNIEHLKSLKLRNGPWFLDWTSISCFRGPSIGGIVTDRMPSHRDLKRFVMHFLVGKHGYIFFDGDISRACMYRSPIFNLTLPLTETKACHLRRMQPRPLCKLVHEVYNFARWGDFSYESRDSKSNTFLCSPESGYVTLASSDISPWDLIQNNIDMLAPCPLEDIG
ncbi:uncharacterized protein BDW43DRAFT_318962 [Aspergillus alliaceus]|uniref:uncharacterized protein n=1 Tax=Petromyces alliaceus TaxID=209559 RepID=UPI0012A69018|nr:uncharacterized protein BDW43DRAFT_318962 [Aspergillus alliaceus]KAB8234118.1 hypothetical protein BDW43DRAFT_318962 [Aspergillus alliaceus]